MRELHDHPRYSAKKDDFVLLTQYLQNTLSMLEINGAIVFGSFVREEQVSTEHSDVDIIAYSASFCRETSKKFQEIIKSKGGNFLDKPPLFIEDFISPRIEYYLCLGNTTFDINIFPMELGGYKECYVNGTHDALEMVIGAMYIEARLLFGKIPFEKILQEEFMPYYCDELRKKRMDQLEVRIRAELAKIQYGLDHSKEDILYHVYKTREYLIKWMFINARKYPVSYVRYLQRQLIGVLGMPHQVVDHLLLKSSTQKLACSLFVKTALNILSNMKNGKLEEKDADE